MHTHVLIKQDDKMIPDNKGEIRLFGKVYNEMVRLPYFLQYHRQLGVNRFIIIDNNSNDGTTEFLLAQPDCHVFHTTDSLKQSRAGADWANPLLDRYGTGQWCLFLDADELFIYPHCETMRLPELCAFLEQEGSDAMFAFMLDMYPDGSLEQAVCTEGKSFLEVCPYFDKDYAFLNRINLKGKKQFPPQEVIGGPRLRCFYPDQKNLSLRRRLVVHVLRRMRDILENKGFPVPKISVKSPDLFKIPLVKWKKGCAYTSAAHEMRPVKLSSITAVLAHFKFFSDFHDRAVKAIASGQYAGGSTEYKRYFDNIGSLGNLMYAGSTRYTSSEDVRRCGLIQSSEAFDQAAMASCRQEKKAG